MGPIQESFLHFLWQFQCFDQNSLQTADGQGLQVLKIGTLNTHAGPDFSEARLLIDGIEWVGNVEMHLRASDWHLHQHQHNKAYENVILHVVWEDDKPIFRQDGSQIATLELNTRTSDGLLTKYKLLVGSKDVIPCASQMAEVDDLTRLSMLDKTLMQRLEKKALSVEELLKINHFDWEETAYQVLARNFGFKLNAEPFLQLAQRLPLKILQKHRHQPQQIEALLFGVAGFLRDEPADEYQAALKKEFQVLATKYSLKDKLVGQHEWKFLRLRPANFPTVRLAQFARLIEVQPSLFSLFIHTEAKSEIEEKLRTKQSVYWQTHYLFGRKAATKVAGLGKQSLENLMINTLVPLLVCYAQQKDNREFLERAVRLLEKLPAEHNHITDTFASLDLKVKTAFDSQAIIELYHYFCQTKQCLRCNIGASLVRKY